MTRPVFLEFEVAVWEDLLRHLLPPQPHAEEAGFLFAKPDGCTNEELVLRVVGHEFVGPDGFDLRSLYAIELSDETRARVIKRAHDLSASLVEVHSHPFPYPAEFSPSDNIGLEEIVPHMRWRLSQRPYVALVVAPKSFDGLVWVEGGDSQPSTLTGVCVGGECLRPTGRSATAWRPQDG